METLLEKARYIEVLRLKDECREYREEINRLRAENERLLSAIKKVVNQGVIETSGPYSQHKNNQCKHGRFGFEGCDACVEEYLQRVLDGGTV